MLNRVLVHIVEVATKSKILVYAFVCILLLREYLHAFGRPSETQVRPLVPKISRQPFDEDHIATKLAEMGLWALLKDIRLDVIDMPKRVIEISQDFERAT